MTTSFGALLIEGYHDYMRHASSSHRIISNVFFSWCFQLSYDFGSPLRIGAHIAMVLTKLSRGREM